MTLVGSQGTSNNLYRIAAAFAAIFFLGHTFGAIVRAPYFDSAAAAVRSSMEQVVFPCNGAQCTWFGFYLGFGIVVSIFLLFAAFLLWFVGGLPVSTRVTLKPVTIALLVAFALLAATSKVYFFPAPLVLSSIITALLALIAIRFP